MYLQPGEWELLASSSAQKPRKTLRKHYLLWICLTVSTRLQNVSDTQISVPEEKRQLLTVFIHPLTWGGYMAEKGVSSSGGRNSWARDLGKLLLLRDLSLVFVFWRTKSHRPHC